MTELVNITDQKAVTTSIIVAESFEKQHKNVVRAIERLECPKDFTELNFEPSSYKDASGRMLPSFNITRDGFMLLAMGFTGKKATQFKIKFIEAFNAMEAELLSGRADRKQIDINHNRKTTAPMGLDVKYSLDLTKIVMKPNTVGVSLLERLTGIDMTDVHDLINETDLGSYAAADKGDAELVAAHLYAILNTSGSSQIEIGRADDGTTHIIGTTTGIIEAMQQAGQEKSLPPIKFSAAKLGQIFHQRSFELEHLGWKRAIFKTVKGYRYFKYTCLIVSG